MAILEVRNIEKHFGRTNVLKDVSFSMEEGNALSDNRFIRLRKDYAVNGVLISLKGLTVARLL